MKKWQIPY